MKSKVFTHIVSNMLIVLIICGVAVSVFCGGVISTFGGSDYKPIYRGSGSGQVTLMVNVYWGTEYLSQILEIFNKYNVKTTFFVGGCWVAQNPQCLQQIVSCGHEIGNHGYFHKQHSKLSYEQNTSEIAMCAKVIWEYSGTNCNLFAPPGGDYCTDTLKAAFDNGYKTIMWSRDTIDWRDKDSNVIYERATKNVADGELILIHPTLPTVNALEKIIKYYLANGFSIVPVSQNIGEIWTSTNNIPVG